MPPRKTTRKAGAVKKVPRRPGLGKTKGVSAELTYEETQEFLGKMEKWWGELGEEVAAMEKLLEGFKASESLSPDARRKFKTLVDRIRRDMACVFPFVRDHGQCMPSC